MILSSFRGFERIGSVFSGQRGTNFLLGLTIPARTYSLLSLSPSNEKATKINMSNDGRCCPTDIKPARGDYVGRGRIVEGNSQFDGKLYVTDPTNSGNTATMAIIQVFDIFGMSPNADCFADHLASGLQCPVVIPDFFRGNPWPIDNLPPVKEGKFPKGVEPEDGYGALMKWMASNPHCRSERPDEIQAIKTYLQTEFPSVTKIGIVGLCWGAKVAYESTAAAADPSMIAAIAGVHPSQLTKEMIEKIQVPMCLLNSKDEGEVYTTDIQPAMAAKPFAEKNFFKVFPTMWHGWMGTRRMPDLSEDVLKDQEVQYAQGMADLVAFFRKALA